LIEEGGEEKEMVEDLVVAGMNAGCEKAEERRNKRMGGLREGVGGGMGELLGYIRGVKGNKGGVKLGFVV
ncbi:YbaB/EbfC family nucleoid-associated protein, partial [Neisseria sicca]|uniref:YbaB/EbfC family nucleoid-associated protein n=1 Tax=Neisseria sicca TaxID=490 RepID=UPI0016498382